MQIVLKRVYSPYGVNGELYVKHRLLCNSIELPWLDNQVGKSCIPEGEYTLKLRYSSRFKWHLHLLDVPDRELILIHPANDALKELLGCIAPVSALSGPGRGTASVVAFNKLKQIIYPVLKRRERASILITSK